MTQSKDEQIQALVAVRSRLQRERDALKKKLDRMTAKRDCLRAIVWSCRRRLKEFAEPGDELEDTVYRMVCAVVHARGHFDELATILKHLSEETIRSRHCANTLSFECGLMPPRSSESRRQEEMRCDTEGEKA